MYRILMFGLDAFSTAVVAVPILIILFITVYRGSTKRRMALLLLFAMYIAAVFGAVGMPTIESFTPDFSFNIIPLLDIIHSPVDYLKNSLLNIVLFIPLGCIAPVLWNRFRRFKNMVLFGFFISLIIEISQIFTFRLTDIDDLITNTIGAAAGYLIVKGLLAGNAGRLSVLSDTESSKKSEAAVVVVVVFVVRFLFKSVVYGLLLPY